MSRTIHSKLTLAAIAAAVAAISLPAQAVDWGGYFRSGPGTTKKDASRACYGLNGDGLKYRLGNECDFYGEFLLSQGFKTDGVEYKANLMTNLYSPGTDTGAGSTDVDRVKNSKVGINQMYVEGKGFDVAPNATFWAGKRFYARYDVHIVDKYFTELNGVGAGVYGIDAGVGKVGLSYFKTDADAVKSGNRLNLEYNDIATNPGGKLTLVGTYTKGNFTGGTSGYGLSAMHQQDNVLGLGGGNTLWVQYAQGSASLSGNFGDLAAPSGNKSFRIVESMTWQVGPLGGQALALWQKDNSDVVGTPDMTSMSLGGRASYALTKNFKMVAEAGYSQKKPDGGATAKLAKFTLAPTLSTGPGFWNRPELRLYVTTAKWNAAANAAAGAGGVTGIGDGKTTGTSYGAQVEIWF